MDNNKMLRNILSFAAAVAVGALPVFLYFFLVEKGVGDALLYSAGSYVFVIGVCILGAIAVWLTLKRPLAATDEAQNTDATVEDEYEEHEKEGAVFVSEAVPDTALEEYPELFGMKAVEEEVECEEETAPLAYHEALANVLAAQKAEYAPEEEAEKTDESDLFLEEILKKPEKNEDEIPDIYRDIPMELPEGYTLYEEESFEDEADEDDETAGSDSLVRPRRGIGETVASKIAVSAAALFTASIYCAVSALGYTVYSESGLTVSNLGKRTTYTWEDCTHYEIAPAFFADRLSVTLFMRDGRSVELLPSDLTVGKQFFEKYGNVYSYALAVEEALEKAGAEKAVRERNTIESEFADNEDIGEQIMKLID